MFTSTQVKTKTENSIAEPVENILHQKIKVNSRNDILKLILLMMEENKLLTHKFIMHLKLLIDHEGVTSSVLNF